MTTRTWMTLTVALFVCWVATAQPPTPSKLPDLPGAPVPPVPPPPILDPSRIEPDPVVQSLNQEETQLRADQERIQTRLAAINKELAQAKTREVGQITATVEGLLYDTEKPNPYILVRFAEKQEFRVYFVAMDLDNSLPKVPLPPQTKAIPSKLEVQKLAGHLVVATGRLHPMPANETRGIPVGAFQIALDKLIAKSTETPALPAPPGLPPQPVPSLPK